MTTPTQLASPPEETIQNVLQDYPQIRFAALIGSRVQGTATPDSDWDIAIRWEYGQDWMKTLSTTETLRRRIAGVLGVAESKVDLIDLSRANLAMRASVAEEGKLLKGQDTLAWFHFLQRTWRELEDFYWDLHHAT